MYTVHTHLSSSIAIIAFDRTLLVNVNIRDRDQCAAVPFGIMCETAEDMTIVKSSDTILTTPATPASEPNRNSVPVKTATIPNTGTTIQPVATVTTADILQSIPFSKARLQELVREIDPTQQLDDDVEEALLQVADDFLENSMNTACRFAEHRKGTVVEARDVQLHLQQTWKLWVPGFGHNTDFQQQMRTGGSEVHKQRMAVIRKATKK